MSTLIKHWQPILAAVITAIVTALIAYGVHSFLVDRIEKKHEKALKQLEGQCLGAKLTPYRISDAYQQVRTNNGSRFDDYLLRLNMSDAGQLSPAASGRDAGQSARAVVSGPRCPDRRAILELGRDADNERAQRRACQAYVREVRKAMGQ